MGLSASQGRLLTLTARKNNIEYQIQQTTQAKMLLANEMDEEATLWSDGMNIQHLYYSKDGCNASRTDDLPRLSYQLVTGSTEDGGLGMQVRDSFGRLIVPELPDPMPDDKTVADYGEGKEEFDCTLSIITPSAHIHIPSGFNDKKTERYVVKCLNEAMRLHEAGESGYLIYYDSYTDRIISESKDDYVRRKYFDSGAVSVPDEKGTAAKNL